MEKIYNQIVQTQCGRKVNLMRAARYAQNLNAPYGEHNFAIFKLPNGFYLKGYNTGSSDKPFDAFTIVSPNEALHLMKAA